MLRITAYADRLEKDLETLDWPESIKKLQRDWIGRSAGAEVDFYIGSRPAYAAWKADSRRLGLSAQAGRRCAADLHDSARHAVRGNVHGDRAGASVCRAADHAGAEAAVEDYCASAAQERPRPQEDKEKTGVFTGSYAINPVNGQEVPIWIADYVLISYGTGAIMAVPAHDTRDFEFANVQDPDHRGGRSRRCRGR